MNILKVKKALFEDKTFNDMIKNIISSYLDTHLDKKIEEYHNKYMNNLHKDEVVNKIKLYANDLIQLFSIKGDIDNGK